MNVSLLSNLLNELEDIDILLKSNSFNTHFKRKPPDVWPSHFRRNWGLNDLSLLDAIHLENNPTRESEANYM